MLSISRFSNTNFVTLFLLCCLREWLELMRMMQITERIWIITKIPHCLKLRLVWLKSKYMIKIDNYFKGYFDRLVV